MQKIVMIQGLQFGSEAKGSIAAGVAKDWKPDTTVTAWGPNAGHTVRDGDFKFVSSMLATGSLYPDVHTVLIGPGSVVDFKKLTAEVLEAGERLRGKRILIHPQAAYLKPGNAEKEASTLLRIGSTMKGTMEAVYDKMRRVEIATVGGVLVSLRDELLEAAEKVELFVSFNEDKYDKAVDDSERMLIEGAQGFSLGIHGQFYPYCTSRDVSTVQTLADCRIPYPAGPQEQMAIIGVLRTYPIRVANRMGEHGQKYTSGGIYEDQVELDWQKDLGREPELTTVTKLPRRVFSFSYEQIRQAVRIVRPTQLALTFCDYLEDKPVFNKDEVGEMGPRVRNMIRAIREATDKAGHGVNVETVSYGPDLADTFEMAPGYGVKQNAFKE
jgi:adenylosuccinate synthase